MTASELFNIFALNFTIVHLSCSKPNLIKTNLCGTNFPILCDFWSTWWKSISKKFSFQGSFAKVDLQKLITDWSLIFIFTFIFSDFVIGSFPMIKKQCIFAKINTCEIWEITLEVFLFKLFLERAVLIKQRSCTLVFSRSLVYSHLI